MKTALRVLTGLLGTFFTLQAVLWLAAPARAAAGLGMPLLDGIGRSTQIGDFSSFFLAIGGGILLGVRAGRARWLYFPAALLGLAAVGRTLAWGVHGAAFAAAPIVVEVVSALVLLAAARQLDRA
jgi:hypothetical protein